MINEKTLVTVIVYKLTTVIRYDIGLQALHHKQTKSSDRNLAQHEIKLEIYKYNIINMKSININILTDFA